MKFTVSTILALAGSAFAAAAPQARSLSTNHGTLSAPAPNSLVSSSGSFPFAYRQSNWCQDGYSQVLVWLTDFQPTSADVNPSTGLVAPAVHSFGTFTAANFGLPPLANQLPSSLTMPDLAGKGISSGDALYVTVVERAANCPPGGVPAQYGFTSVGVSFA